MTTAGSGLSEIQSSAGADRTHRAPGGRESVGRCRFDALRMMLMKRVVVGAVAGEEKSEEL